MFGALTRYYSGAMVPEKTDLGIEVSRSVYSQVPDTVRGMEHLPGSINQRTVVLQAKEAEQQEVVNELLAEYIKHRERSLTALAKRHRMQVSYQQKFMHTAQEIAKSDADFTRALGRHGLVMGVEKQQIAGFRQAYENASTLLG